VGSVLPSCWEGHGVNQVAMGCAASVMGRRAVPYTTKQALLRDDLREGLVTPPNGDQAPLHPNATRLPLGKAGLRIDPIIASRSEAGIAETPVGKQAEEYKYYCPLCMMFFQSMLELPCCQQSTCTFCFQEYVQRQLSKPTGLSDAAPFDTSPRDLSLLLPTGIACPQCAVVSTATRELRVLQGRDEPKVRYFDSPETRARLEMLSKRASGDDGTVNSPLKVGDDNAMARKMIPFPDMPIVEAEAEGHADAEAGIGVLPAPTESTAPASDVQPAAVESSQAPATESDPSVIERESAGMQAEDTGVHAQPDGREAAPTPDG
jgi:hypothetical protein